MKQISILAIGRLKDPSWKNSCQDYYRRCSRLFHLAEREVRDLKELKAALPERALVILLDERGKQMTSRDFSALLHRYLEGPLTNLCFLIGGPDGVDENLRRQADHVISLSAMTLAHRIVRLFLAEQIYRAVSIIEGSPYHRE